MISGSERAANLAGKDITRSGAYKLKSDKIQLQNFLAVRVIKHWNCSPGEVRNSPLLRQNWVY